MSWREEDLIVLEFLIWGFFCFRGINRKEKRVDIGGGEEFFFFN